MSYSIYLFGVDGDGLQRTLATDTELVPRVLSHISRSASPSEADLALLHSLLSRGVQGTWAPEDAPDTFTALCWLLDVVAEPIVVGGLRGFSHWAYWEDAGLWPHFLMVPPPMPVPTSDEKPPIVGFLPCAMFADLLSSDEPESAASSQDVRAVRTEVLEIIESLQDDRLDLVAVVT